MTDCEFILDQLGDGEEHTLTDLLRASIDLRGHGLTVHSRVSDLRKRGHVIEHVTVQGAQRGAGHAYRLVSLAQPEVKHVPSNHQSPASGSTNDSELQLFADARPQAYRDAA